MTGDICHGTTLTDSCGREATHLVPINAPTGYREQTHCMECARRRSEQTYVGDPKLLPEGHEA